MGRERVFRKILFRIVIIIIGPPSHTTGVSNFNRSHMGRERFLARKKFPITSVKLFGMGKVSGITKKNFKIGTFIRTNRYISETALPITETKKRKHFAIQSTPQNLGKLTSETTFGHSKVVFRPLLRTKRTFSRKALVARFLNFLW